jgi:outer membrane lipoprotein-sorting protein
VTSKGETIISIAKKLQLSEYMIMQHNGLGSYTSIHIGQTIMVPNNYGKEITMYIDQATMLPLLLQVNDEKGLFEQYIFRNINLNVTISANEFSRKNKEYHF